MPTINYSEYEPRPNVVMQFPEFAKLVDGAVRAATSVERHDDAAGSSVWATRERNAAMMLVAPLNVSVALGGAGARTDTMWYPIDEALVAVVSRRIAGYLNEA